MSFATVLARNERLLPQERWQDQLPDLADEYARNQPFPHIHLPGFLEETAIRELVDAFPRPGDTSWIQYKHFNENKLGKNNRAEFPPRIGHLIDDLNSPEFVAWLSELTGIPDLMPDPGLEGGGMHQTERGGFLNMHTDFTHHHYQTRWRRRCNLILYLNPGWNEEWGGSLELWDRDMKACAVKYPPLANHCVIFNTTDTSFHGYPDPITCPAEVTRKSIALYYYTLDAEGETGPRATNYRARPGDGLRSMLIWLDNRLLGVYSALKRKLGLSDQFASTVLGFLGRKKK